VEWHSKGRLAAINLWLIGALVNNGVYVTLGLVRAIGESICSDVARGRVQVAIKGREPFAIAFSSKSLVAHQCSSLAVYIAPQLLGALQSMQCAMYVACQ